MSTPMNSSSLTKEEKNFKLGIGIAIHEEDELLARVAELNLNYESELLKTRLKKMMVVYNLLKKFWNDDKDGFDKFIRLCIKIHRISLVCICLLATASIDIEKTMENAEKAERENDYLLTANYLKFLYDLRAEAQ